MVPTARAFATTSYELELLIMNPLNPLNLT
jgi:hypothetical protein